METILIEILRWILSIGGLVKLTEIILNYSERRRQKNSYLQFIAQKFEYIDFPKTGSLVPLLPLEAIYIRTRVGKYSPWLSTQSQGNTQSANDFVSISKALYKESRKEKKPLRLAILGSAGSGKTTLMKWLALQCVSRKKNFFSRFVPVYISLDEPGLDLADICKEANLQTLVHKRLEKAGFKFSFFDKEFEAGNVLFLFDGLKKEADEGRCNVTEWLQAKDIRKNVLLITTRRTGFDDSCLPDFNPPIPILAVQDFTLEDINDFLKKWFRSVEINKLAYPDRKRIEDAEKKAQGKCQDIMNIIKNNNNKIYLRLSEKPLCLTTNALVFSVRGRLPEKLSELCREVFRVAIKLLENKRFPANDETSVEKVMEYLSHIATLLLENNCKEMSFAQIYAPLHELVDVEELSSLLEDMVEKTGLIYKVDDQYGFTHVTFQEYLVAWYFTRNSNYTQMLGYRNDDNWTEVFKLFVNMAEENVTRQFFNEIIQGLVEKEYWKQMRLWDNCLLNIAEEKMQNAVEIQFAQQVLQILAATQYERGSIDTENVQSAKMDIEKMIIYFYIHYPLFKHAARFRSQAWDLFYNARHPLVQTLGSSIIHDVAMDEPEEGVKLVTALKERITEFEKKATITREEAIDFLYRNHNSIPLIIALRKNLLDLSYALGKLKSPHLLIRYLFLLNFNNFPYTLEAMDLLVLPELKEILGFLDTRKFVKRLDISACFDLWAVRDFMTLQGFVDLQPKMDLRSFMDSPLYGNILYILDRYEHKFREKLKDIEIITKIDGWVNNAYTKLNSLPDEKLEAFFPGTTKEEINQFRADCMKPIEMDKN